MKYTVQLHKDGIVTDLISVYNLKEACQIQNDYQYRARLLNVGKVGNGTYKVTGVK